VTQEGGKRTYGQKVVWTIGVIGTSVKEVLWGQEKKKSWKKKGSGKDRKLKWQNKHPWTTLDLVWPLVK